MKQALLSHAPHCRQCVGVGGVSHKARSAHRTLYRGVVVRVDARDKTQHVLQARDLRAALSAEVGGPGSAAAPQAMRRSELFQGRWVEDAVLRYLNRRIAAGS